MLKELDGKTADDLEDQCLDFKRWSNDEKDNKKNLLREAVGFANQKGGTIVFGVENNKKGISDACTGCPDTLNPEELYHYLYKSSDPTILPEFDCIEAPNGKKLLLVFVEPNRDLWPCSSTDGTYWIRMHKSTEPLKGTTLRSMFLRLLNNSSLDERAIQTVKAFADALSSVDSQVANQAAKTLARNGEIEELIEQWLSNQSEMGDIDVITRVQNSWIKMKGDSEKAEYVLNRIQSETEDRLPAFIAALAAIAPEQALEPLGKILKEHSSPSVRAQAVRALSEIKDGRAAKLLHEQLIAEADAGVLKELMDRIEVGADSIPGFCKQIKHSAWPIRERAARALGEAGADDDAVIQALDEATSDTQPEVVLTAINSLKAIVGEAAESVLKKVLDDAERPLEIRGAALEALKELRAKQAA
jgi:HEAT repeat protein